MKKLVFLTTQLPYPPESGGVIKSFQLLKYLSTHYEVTLLTLLKNNDRAFQTELLDQVSISKFIGKEQSAKRNALSFLKSILTGKTLNEFRNYSSEFQSKIEAGLVETDLIFIDHFEMFQYVPKRLFEKVVFHEHNAEWLLWERFSEIEENSIKSRILKFESSRIRKKELDYVKQAKITLASPNDKIQLQKNGANGLKIKETYHLGNDQLLKLPNPDYSELPNDIVFMGTLSWEANVDGLLNFMSEIFPEILKSDSSVKLNVVGRKPDTRLLEAAKPFAENVVFHGFVETIEDVFKLGKVFILPLRFGSGMKVKCLDALYSGTPIVTTTIGAEGIDLEHNKHAMISDDPKQFSNYVLEILSNPEKWSSMSEQGRFLAKQKYTWETHLEQIGIELNSIF